MRIKRTIPPAAAPISIPDLMHGFHGIMNNKFISRLESELKDYFESRYVFLVSSGKGALYLILSGLYQITGKKKVIIPAYTCFSVPSAVKLAGLDIVLCDIKPDTLDFDYTELVKLVDEDTLCIISTHLFGVPSNINKIRNICRNKNIFIVEDAAQAMGSILNKKKAGTYGDVGFFSLGRGKNITCGSGGIVITSNKEIADSIRRFYSELKSEPVIEYTKNILEVIFQRIFTHPYLYWFPRSLPFLKIGETKYYSNFPVYKLTGFKAGLLYNWQKNLETYKRSRETNGEYYIREFSFQDKMPIYSNGIQYLRFPLYLKSKELKDKLCSIGNTFGISPMYPISINRIKQLQEDFRDFKFQNSDLIADTLVSLPTHVLLNEKDRINICNAIKGYFVPVSKNEFHVA